MHSPTFRHGCPNDGLECFPRLVLLVPMLLWCEFRIIKGRNIRRITFPNPPLQRPKLRSFDRREERASAGVVARAESSYESVSVGFGGAADRSMELVDERSRLLVGRRLQQRGAHEERIEGFEGDFEIDGVDVASIFVGCRCGRDKLCWGLVGKRKAGLAGFGSFSHGIFACCS